MGQPADRNPLVVLTPVYEDRVSARMMMRDLKAELPDLHLLVVEDGSVRDPVRPDDLAEIGIRGEILYLVRNMGHQRAIATGLAYAAERHAGSDVVVLDADGEDRPADVPRVVEALRRSDADLVVVKRGRRSASRGFRLLYRAYRLLFGLLTGRTIDFGNFMALRSSAVRRLTKMQELWVHFPATVIVSRLRVESLKSDRGERYAGDSSMSFLSLVLHGARSVMVFAEDVLVRLGVLCVIVAVFALAGIIAVLCLKYFGMATPGWVTTVAGFLVVIFFQIGILTLITLMITGIVRGGPTVLRIDLDELIERVQPVP